MDFGGLLHCFYMGGENAVEYVVSAVICVLILLAFHGRLVAFMYIEKRGTYCFQVRGINCPYWRETVWPHP